MILIPIFVVLFACWMLWAWTVGESKDIKWMRLWFAPIFVVTAMLISAGAGAGIAVVLVRQRISSDVSELLVTIEDKINSGAAADVAAEIRLTDHRGDPDRDAFDLLKHLPVMQQNLAGEGNAETVAETTGGLILR
ncbi:MAG: hypothetical protein R3C59_03415 [Planctomycetaceae bacterium]